jgi:hypothetical protein
MTTQIFKRPTWMTVLGILGIAFGLLGLMGSLPNIIAPKIMQFQQRMLQSFAEMEPSDGNPPPKELMDTFESLFRVPGWFETWMVISGILGIFIMGFYIYASIVLLNSKPNSLKLYFQAMWASIGLGILQAILGFSTNTLFGLGFGIGGLISIVIDVVLLSVAYSNREEFRQYMAQLHPREVNPYISSQE